MKIKNEEIKFEIVEVLDGEEKIFGVFLSKEIAEDIYRHLKLRYSLNLIFREVHSSL